MWGIYILISWLLADLVTGIIHWAQDILLTGNPKLQFLVRIKADNDLHHFRPAAMLKDSYWGTINTSAPAAWTLSALALVCHCHTIVWLTLFFSAFANLIHRFSHAPKKQRGIFVRFMQWTGLFISIEHHKAHHYDSNGVIPKEKTNQKYCVMTNWLNPVLDRIGFFKFLTFIFKHK